MKQNYQNSIEKPKLLQILRNILKRKVKLTISYISFMKNIYSENLN